jgi:hypothetical protein
MAYTSHMVAKGRTFCYTCVPLCPVDSIDVANEGARIEQSRCRGKHWVKCVGSYPCHKLWLTLFRFFMNFLDGRQWQEDDVDRQRDKVYDKAYEKVCRHVVHRNLTCTGCGECSNNCTSEAMRKREVPELP